LLAIIYLSGYQVKENDTGASVGTFWFNFPHVEEAHASIILSGPDADWFEVVDNRLKLKVGQRANYESQAIFNLTAAALDSGGRLKSQAIALTVVDLNEAPTEILVTNSEIEEGSKGVVVGDLTVLDPDENDSHIISLSSVEDGGLFEIVGGQLKLREHVSADYESSQPYYLLYLTATDTEGKSISQWLSVNVAESYQPTEQTVFHGSLGADYLVGFFSFSVLNGGAGTDSVTYLLASDEVRFSLDPAGQLVVEKVSEPLPSLNDLETNVTVNTLVAIERLLFSDKGFALDISGDAGVAAKTIIASFGVSTLNAYMVPALSVVDGGMNLDQVCDLVVDYQLIESVTGSNSNGSFVDHLYKNVVGIAPSQVEHDAITALLDNGTYTKSSLLAFAANTTLAADILIANSVDLIGVPGSTDGQVLAIAYDLG